MQRTGTTGAESYTIDIAFIWVTFVNIAVVVIVSVHAYWRLDSIFTYAVTFDSGRTSTNLP